MEKLHHTKHAVDSVQHKGTKRPFIPSHEDAGYETDNPLVKEKHSAEFPKEDIVLAFHAPYKRPYTGYAVR